MRNYIIANGNTTYILEEVTAPKAARAICSPDYKEYSTIWDAYKNPSYRKEAAWRYCVDMCRALDGQNIRITAAGCQTFSVKFEFLHPESGELCTAYITRDYNRFAYPNRIKKTA